jgi:hypothetical protein
MKLRLATLADTVIPQSDGKLNVIGMGIDIIRAPVYPYLHPTLFALFIVVFEGNEIGRTHRLQMQFFSPDGPKIPPADFEMILQPPEHPDLPVKGNIVAGFQGFPFASPGTYVWRLVNLADGKTIGEVTAKALPASASPRSARPASPASRRRPASKTR